MKNFTLAHISLFITCILIFLFSCSSENSTKYPDTIYHNGKIYTSDENQPSVELVAIADGKIIFAGPESALDSLNGEKTKTVDLSGKVMFPGFIESHGHLYGLGNMKQVLNLMDIENYDALVDTVGKLCADLPSGDWIRGRGWHQEKWNEKDPYWLNGLPDNRALNAVSPDNPVILRRAGGHSALANKLALEKAGISKGNIPEVNGGAIDLFPDGTPTGMLHENAIQLVGKVVQSDITQKDIIETYKLAMEACVSHGMTTFNDAGISGANIDLLKSIKDREMMPRLYLMLSGSDSALIYNWFDKGTYQSDDDKITVRSIKLYADGALGNRGAWMLEDYTDRPHHHGFPLMPMDQVERISERALEQGFQICTHAIGDRANREVLNAYESAFEAYPDKARDARFRVEHAQHLTSEDIPRFANLDVIASMQGIHMASDRPWAIDRLGKERIEEGAYVWQKLIKSGATIINGTDVPVEPINFWDCFYASVTRKTLKGTPDGGYEPDQKMTREQALKSYTINAAYGCFKEDEIGSIEIGKRADFTILDRDIMTIPEHEILGTVVLSTIVDGVEVYRNEKE